MSEQNKALVRRAVEEVWNGGNYAAIADLAAEDLVVHAAIPGEELHGREAVVQFYEALRAAFPDIRFTVEDQIAEGDRVATRWRARATHAGAFHGIPPTGRQGVITGIDIDRIVDGKVAECWPNADELGLLRQLGVLATPEAAAP